MGQGIEEYSPHVRGFENLQWVRYVDYTFYRNIPAPTDADSCTLDITLFLDVPCPSSIRSR